VSSVVAQDRLGLGGSAVLPAREAARLLPVSSTRAMEWLESKGLIRDLMGVRVVIWGDVLSALVDEATAAQNRRRGPAPPRAGLRERAAS
jgi:hypothetical protein